MSDPKKPDDQEPVHSIAAATLVCGIIDGTYESIVGGPDRARKVAAGPIKAPIEF